MVVTAAAAVLPAWMVLQMQEVAHEVFGALEGRGGMPMRMQKRGRMRSGCPSRQFTGWSGLGMRLRNESTVCERVSVIMHSLSKKDSIFTALICSSMGMACQ